MSDQPTALQLAAQLEAELVRTVDLDTVYHQAASELRWLNAIIEKLDDELTVCGDLKREYQRREADAIDRIEALELALLEWHDKTEWVQQTSKAKELGKHRADVLRDRIEALEAERDRNLDSINVGNKIITDLRGENAVLVGLLRDCDAVLAVIEADDGDEAEKARDLRVALLYALDPYKREGTLL